MVYRYAPHHRGLQHVALKQQMASTDLSHLSHAQRDRLAFIELRLWFLGCIGRQDLVGRFGIQTAAATRDLSQYRDLAPRNLEYDAREKSYRQTQDFWPVFDFPVEHVLTWLANGCCDGEATGLRGPVRREIVGQPGRLDLDQLSVLTRAIYDRAVVEIAYRSLTSGLTTREIVPFALADAGLRWVVRAFDRRSGDFRDFVLGRLEDARLVPGPVADHENPDQDIQWNRITELELVPHPANVQHPDTIEAEYAMVGGVVKVRARAAMVGYLLRQWNVDCTDDHSLRGIGYHLWLRNRAALYGVTNLALAPGYIGDEATAVE